MKYKHLFGPVTSRRLGVSLGIDLVPYKYCPLNCVYCEVQSTTHLQTKREEFFPTQEILDELDSFMRDRPHLDYITFSGAGEPTLNSSIKDIIIHVKRHYPEYKLALLTNGVLLNDDAVLSEILPCDLILPSLDAATQKVYETINRPKAGLKVEDLISGLVKLRERYQGQIWLEVFIIPSINDLEEELIPLKDAISRIMPDIVQLNSLDRPGAEEWVEAATVRDLKKVKDFLAPSLSSAIEIIAKIKYNSGLDSLDAEVVSFIQSTLSRRPSTAEDLSAMLNIHINEIMKILRELAHEGKLEAERMARGVFYTWKS
jgi:wyosine [tRNA(Phe)-imidazoG37] synthetase (radical SAM superfamily)